MERRILVSVLSLGAVLLGYAAVVAEDAEVTPENVVVDGNLHTPAELLKLLVKSELTYVIDIWQDSIMPQDTSYPVVLNPMTWAKVVDGQPKYGLLVLSDSLQPLLDSAEAAFKEKDLDVALSLYRLLLEKAPEYVHTRTLIGDVFFMRGEYDSAASYYRQAIDANSSDYQAHWFLGDALEKMGDTVEAIRELTIAHILNIHHKTLKKALVAMRDHSGKLWKEWEFKPRYILKQDSGKVMVISDNQSMFYALTKALWAYEPGYEAKMRDTSDIVDRILELEEEREAVACAWLSADSSKKDFYEQIGADNFQQFVLYEVIAKRDPYLMLHLDERSLNLLVEYVNRFH
jgi:tetratricopeptide (TPR) repeat protein